VPCRLRRAGWRVGFATNCGDYAGSGWGGEPFLCGPLVQYRTNGDPNPHTPGTGRPAGANPRGLPPSGGYIYNGMAAFGFDFPGKERTAWAKPSGSR
jgi:hypothetical protein